MESKVGRILKDCEVRSALKKILQEIEHRHLTGELTKKRFACAHCGKTWIEPAGLVVARKDGIEDVVLRIGMDSEARECQKCGTSEDVYEIRVGEEVRRRG